MDYGRVQGCINQDSHTEETGWTKSGKKRGMVWIDFMKFKLCAVYISPNVKFEIYREYLNQLETKMIS